jgi:hypothetical protein
MNSISVGQSWGISSGLPAGHDVALKNGFYPLTVMTEGSSTEAPGIALVELVTAHVNDRLTVGDAADLRPINGGEAVPLLGPRVCAPLVGAS